MTDHHTIEAAYARLTTALEPPPAHRDLVAARVVVRRRRRRVARGAASATLVAAAAGAVVVGTSGQAAITAPTDRPVPVATDTTGSTDPAPDPSTEPTRPPGAPNELPAGFCSWSDEEIREHFEASYGDIVVRLRIVDARAAVVSLEYDDNVNGRPTVHVVCGPPGAQP